MINLIGCVCKIVSKLLADRLKRVLDTIIGKEQSAFIKGQCILDGPLIVNETISWARKAKRKVLIFKADFEKAFDNLNWDFLDEVICQMEFSNTWRKWTRGIFSNAIVSILVNGSPTEEFIIGKRVVMYEARIKGVFNGLSLPRGGPRIEILQYADDALFMGDWSLTNGLNLICEAELLTQRMNCKLSSIPFQYLGLPAKSLSFGGRKILCKSVLGSLGVYLSSLFKVPENVLNTPESLRNQFIWGWTGQSKKIIWIKWKVTCNKMDKGDIGIGSLKALNWGLLAKWWSRFLNEERTLWRASIKAFHGDRGGIF
ncbi:uncharacterized protein LOC112509090 [Cynara cardunculus var. scolymus]|uniref:uncharacterized protein LOC112509090 n=1 Tax=Cynara cardunculus var. scolymus TaxID=59895 RepID=UPI000D6290FC|nr:uncharacterized protein LOC112509090 [Cynara cardunculus var. scolymus]